MNINVVQQAKENILQSSNWEQVSEVTFLQSDFKIQGNNLAGWHTHLGAGV